MKLKVLVSTACLLSVALLATFVHGQGGIVPGEREEPVVSAANRLLSGLAGNWRSTATHFHSDGTLIRETGTSRCRWILKKTYLQCDRQYVASNGQRRISMQLYTLDPATGQFEMLSFRAGRPAHVSQKSDQATGSSVVFSGSIPLKDGKQYSLRGELKVVSGNRLEFSNKIEEAPGRWRIDFEETFWRQSR